MAEIEAIERGAREDGYAAGYAEGLSQGQAEVRRQIAQLAGLIDSFARPFAQLDVEVERALGELALRIAGTLVGRAYATDPALLAELVSVAVSAAGDDIRSADVHLHPDDLAVVGPMLALTDLPRTRLHADAGLGRGDVRVHTDALRIDGALDTRLQAVLARLQDERA